MKVINLSGEVIFFSKVLLGLKCSSEKIALKIVRVGK